MPYCRGPGSPSTGHPGAAGRCRRVRLGAGLRLRQPARSPSDSAMASAHDDGHGRCTLGLCVFLRVPGGELALHHACSLRQFGWYAIPQRLPPRSRVWPFIAPRAVLAGSVLLHRRLRHRDLCLLPHPHRPRALLGVAPLRGRSFSRQSSSASRRRCCCRWRAAPEAGERIAPDEPLCAEAGRAHPRGLEILGC